MSRLITRRKVLTGLAMGAPAVLIGCDRLGSSPSFREMALSSGERLSYHLQRLIAPNTLAREYDPSDMSPDFRTNGNTSPRSADYRSHAAQGFTNWRLQVDGLVQKPSALSLAELRAYSARTQITRHDCVEGWSAVGQWTVVPRGVVGVV